jgi:hypothetical protein
MLRSQWEALRRFGGKCCLLLQCRSVPLTTCVLLVSYLAYSLTLEKYVLPFLRNVWKRTELHFFTNHQIALFNKMLPTDMSCSWQQKLIYRPIRCSIVVKALCYKLEGRGLDTRWGDFLIYLILAAALGSGVYSASNRNEYQKQKNNACGEESAAGA